MNIPSKSTQQQEDTPNPRVLASFFKHKLDDCFNAWNASRPLRTGYPHASSILAHDSMFCLRQLVLLAAYGEYAERPELKPWHAHENAVFLNGWVLHEKYQELLSRFGNIKVVEAEKPHFDDTRLLHFTPDLIVEYCNEFMPVEIKGYKSSTFEKLNESGKPPKAAHEQCNFYCHLLGFRYGLILVENKDNQEYKVWAVEYDKELVQPYLDRMYKFRVALHKAKSGELPARCCQSTSDRLAEKCAMRNFCFERKG